MTRRPFQFLAQLFILTLAVLPVSEPADAERPTAEGMPVVVPGKPSQCGWQPGFSNAITGGTNPRVKALAVHNGALYVGGSFTHAGGIPANNIAKWDGNTWSALSTGTNTGTSSSVNALLSDGSTLYVGGVFFEAGGVPAINLARWDSISNTWSAVTGSGGIAVFALKKLDAYLYVGGTFIYSSYGIARTDLVGNWWPDSYSQDRVAFALESALVFASPSYDWDLFAGGVGISSGGFVAWSPTPGSWSEISGIQVEAMVSNLSNLYVGGSNGVGKWDGTTYQWSSTLDPFSGTVQALAFHDGALYVGGDFRHLPSSGLPMNNIAKWAENDSDRRPLHSGTDGEVFALASYDSALYAGGNFSTAGGVPSASFGKYTYDCEANLEVTKAVDLTSAVPGQTLTYTIDASNNGPHDESSVTLTDNLPAALTCTYTSTVVSGSASGNTLSGSGNLNETLSLPAGSTVRYTMTCNIDVTATGTISNTATISSFAVDPVSGNNSATASTVLIPGANLGVTKSDGVTSAIRGQSLVYTIVASNTGPNNEPSATLTDTLPTGLTCTYTSTAAGGAAGHTASGSGNLNEALSLPVGSSVTYTMTCTVALTATGTLTNTATISGSVTDPALGDNSAIDTTDVQPFLWLPDPEPAAEGETVDVDVNLENAGINLSGVAFSIDYDNTCLNPDADGDTILDQWTQSVPADFDVIVSFNAADTVGEIDVTIVDVNPPPATLANGSLLSIQFKATCSPALGSTELAPVLFSSAPAPSFSDQAAVNVPGTSLDGAVEIYPGPRGDCNGDGFLSVADVVAVGLEMFDADIDDFWTNAPGSTFSGSPVGCDANASTWIRAGDVTCANLLYFGNNCVGVSDLVPLADPPEIDVSTEIDGGMVWIRARLAANGHAVGSLAFSLDLDPARLPFAGIDADGDGEPDVLYFPNGTPGLSTVAFDAADERGEIDVLLADLRFAPLAEGVLVEIGIPADALPDGALRFSGSPPPSFGSVTGLDIEGRAVVEGTVLFADGFESGSTGRWSQTVQ